MKITNQLLPVGLFIGLMNSFLIAQSQSELDSIPRFSFALNVGLNKSFYSGEKLKYTWQKRGNLPISNGVDVSLQAGLKIHSTTTSTTRLRIGVGVSRFTGKLRGYSSIVGNKEVFVVTAMEKLDALIIPITLHREFGARQLKYFYSLGVENDFVLNAKNWGSLDHSKVYVPKLLMEFGLFPITQFSGLSFSLQAKHNILRTRIPSFKDRLYSFGLNASYRF